MSVLISFLDGTTMPDETLEEAVARNASDDAYFVRREDMLICVPDYLVFKTVAPEGVKLPQLGLYLEEHLQEVVDVDLDLWHQYSDPTKH